jgi:hypothetical protein
MTTATLITIAKSEYGTVYKLETHPTFYNCTF